MIYTIVGVPGTGKWDIARKLSAKLDIDTIANRNVEEGGFLADYRQELYIATSRALVTFKPRIEFHSLIDSVAYTSLRLSSILNENPNSPVLGAWGITFDACLQMLLDGYTDDHLTLFIPYTGDDSDCRDLDEALRATLKTLQIKHQVIDPEAEVDTWISN